MQTDSGEAGIIFNPYIPVEVTYTTDIYKRIMNPTQFLTEDSTNPSPCWICKHRTNSFDKALIKISDGHYKPGITKEEIRIGFMYCLKHKMKLHTDIRKMYKLQDLPDWNKAITICQNIKLWVAREAMLKI